jgi:hypothetical protein
MRQGPFAAPGRFYKGNLHTHSTRSDGLLDPEAVVAAYRDRGYDFLALTDHFLPPFDFPITDTRPFRTDDFTTLLGAELHAHRTEFDDFWHILAVGLPADFAPWTLDETGPRLAARAAAAGAFVGIAHPAWYGLTLDDALTIEAAHAVETYNYNCLICCDRADSWHLYDQLLARGQRLTAYAADDAHFNPAEFDAFGGWVHVRAEALAPNALLGALKAGHYYSSTGPELHDLDLAGDDLTVTCSPASAVVISGYGANAITRRGDGLTRCTLPVRQFAGSYLRVTVLDADGRRAWSNPLFLE